MERERFSDEGDAEREKDDKNDRPQDVDDPAIGRAEAVYGDTDLDPNRDDQRDAHHAAADEHV